eukprot:GILJ01008524.1.p1 GENE.GILJ01008524.1~~GILJ01008524.1.p1  ORF type:complete len:434 (+),score=22.47 GILJ01008524.1:717-2018(+)
MQHRVLNEAELKKADVDSLWDTCKSLGLYNGLDHRHPRLHGKEVLVAELLRFAAVQTAASGSNLQAGPGSTSTSSNNMQDYEINGFRNGYDGNVTSTASSFNIGQPEVSDRDGHGNVTGDGGYRTESSDSEQARDARQNQTISEILRHPPRLDHQEVARLMRELDSIETVRHLAEQLYMCHRSFYERVHEHFAQGEAFINGLQMVLQRFHPPVTPGPPPDPTIVSLASVFSAITAAPQTSRNLNIQSSGIRGSVEVTPDPDESDQGTLIVETIQGRAFVDSVQQSEFPPSMADVRVHRFRHISRNSEFEAIDQENSQFLFLPNAAVALCRMEDSSEIKSMKVRIQNALSRYAELLPSIALSTPYQKAWAIAPYGVREGLPHPGRSKRFINASVLIRLCTLLTQGEKAMKNVDQQVERQRQLLHHPGKLHWLLE